MTRPPVVLERMLASLGEAERLRALASSVSGWSELFQTAASHGVAVVLFAALRDAGVVIAEDVSKRVAQLSAVQGLENELALRALGECLRALDLAGIDVVVLKGPLLAERLYGSATARPSLDIDLLVEEGKLERACDALASVGYRTGDVRQLRHDRESHHHVLLFHGTYPIVELHFHGYRGFGTVLPGEPLIARRERSNELPFAASVLSKPDELVYLAVHAGSHRFARLNWLYDIRLLVERMTDAELELAATRAREWGYARLLAFTAQLLDETIGIEPRALEALGQLGAIRSRLVREIVGEPKSSLGRSATRFVYSVALCDTLRSATRYATSASLSRARRLLQ